jgi:hypothetical protein
MDCASHDSLRPAKMLYRAGTLRAIISKICIVGKKGLT